MYNFQVSFLEKFDVTAVANVLKVGPFLHCLITGNIVLSNDTVNQTAPTTLL